MNNWPYTRWTDQRLSQFRRVHRTKRISSQCQKESCKLPSVELHYVITKLNRSQVSHCGGFWAKSSSFRSFLPPFTRRPLQFFYKFPDLYSATQSNTKPHRLIKWTLLWRMVPIDLMLPSIFPVSRKGLLGARIHTLFVRLYVCWYCKLMSAISTQWNRKMSM